jgi:transglutaminase-like putative cysteine protease
LVQSDDPEISSLARQITAGATSEYDASVRIAQWMQGNILYGGGGEGTNDASNTLNNRYGVCEGWAQLFMALARANGIPARFVAGYLIGGSIRYPIAQENGGTMTVVTKPLPHAWVELWYPGYGWVPYDPQSSVGFVDSHHIRVWSGIDAGAAQPLLSWEADSDERLSFAEEQTQASVVDNIAVRCASSDLGSSGRILLSR